MRESAVSAPASTLLGLRRDGALAGLRYTFKRSKKHVKQKIMCVRDATRRSFPLLSIAHWSANGRSVVRYL